MLALADRTRTTVEVEQHGVRDRVRVEVAGAPGRPVVRALLCPLPGSGATRVALVPDGALLLAGDRVELRVRVGAGASVEIVETGGTVAYDMRGGAATWDVDVEVAAGGTLVWAGRELVVASGARVRRSCRARLESGARLAWRETLVLGRHGEEGAGRLHSSTVVHLEGTPLCVDALEIDDTTASRLALGDRRALGSVLVAGVRLPDDIGGPDRLDLEGPGTLVRGLSDEAHRTVSDEVWLAAVGAVAGIGDAQA